MPLFATNIIVTSNGVQQPSPVIQNPPTVVAPRIQAKEFIITGPIKKEHVVPEPRYSHIQAGEILVNVPIKKEHVAPEPRYSHIEAEEILVTGPVQKQHLTPEPKYTHIQAKEFIIKNDHVDVINSLPDVAAVKQSDFIEKSSGYMEHMFTD